MRSLKSGGIAVASPIVVMMKIAARKNQFRQTLL
jgi:hypothetical protein